MDTISGVILFALFSFGVMIYCRFFAAYQWFEGLCRGILFPFYLAHRLFISLSNLLPAMVHYILFGLVSLASVIFLAVSYFHFGDISAFSAAILESTTLVSFINLISSGGAFEESVSYPAMVGVAVSSFASFLYSRYTIQTVESLTSASASRWAPLMSTGAVSLLNILFFFMSAMLAYFLKDWYEAAADALVHFYANLGNDLSSQETDGFFKFLFFLSKGVVFILLTYAAIATFTIVLQEYLATICYGIFNLFFVFLFSLIFGNFVNGLPEILGFLVVILLLSFGDIIRNSETANKAYIRLVNRLGGH